MKHITKEQFESIGFSKIEKILRNHLVSMVFTSL